MPDNLTTEIPSEIEAALNGIINDVFGTEVRDDIVTALRWGLENADSSLVDFFRIVNGKLCLVYTQN